MEAQGGGIPITAVLKIKEHGHGESWLRDMIYDDPSILGRVLGIEELQVMMKEKPQPQGGRIDLLLKDSNDSMYEVELQLGPTDESHIIRTIEYWDNEKRRWPNRSHTAVLIAEEITTRFFNVVQLLSKAVPIIGIQANIVQIGNITGLHFTKVIDSFVEPEEEIPDEGPEADRSYWLNKAPWTVEAADTLLAIVQDVLVDAKLNYVQNYVAIKLAGYNYFALRKRSGLKSLLSFWIAPHLQEEAERILVAKAIAFDKKQKRFQIREVDKNLLDANKIVFRSVAELAKKS